MKKIYLSLLICLFATVSQAQNFGFGPRVGLNVADLKGKNFEESSSRTSYHIGMFGEFKFNNVWACEAAVLYSEQGAQMKWTEQNRLGPLLINAKMKLHYINIPILVKAYVYEGMNLFIGPQVGFLTGATVMGQSAGRSFKTADLSAVVGLGYQFEMGLNIAINYNIGITNIAKPLADETIRIQEAKLPDYTIRNGVFQVSAGWKF